MQITICVEIPIAKGKKKIIHEIRHPKINEPGGYVSSVSLGAFRGKRRGASKEDKEKHRDTCAWRHDAVFALNEQVDEWINVSDQMIESLKNIPCDYDLTDEYADATKDMKSVAEVPRIIHNSVWDFYKHIGFDHKKRRYIQ